MRMVRVGALVIGSGCAGYAAADALFACGVTDCAVLTKGRLDGTSRNTGSDKQTYYKLSLCSDREDSVYGMAADLFAGGAMHGDTALCEAAGSVKAFMKLNLLGVPMTQLMNNRAAYKTFDDRACVTSMLVAMEVLSRVKLNCRVVFCATTQEEVGSRGAKIAAWDVDPDLAVAFDVCHADQPGADPWDTMPIDKVGLGLGPTIHPAMFRRMRDTADALHVDIQLDPSAGTTYTDADNVFETRMGVPTALLSLPLTYMHTMVETISLTACEEAGRLLTGFLTGIDEKWEEWLCF